MANTIRALWRKLFVAGGLAVVLAGARAEATTLWDESVNGDLSGNQSAPTALTLSLGTNAVIATSGERTLTIGEGAVIGAGVVVTKSIPRHRFVASGTPVAVGDALVPLTKAATMEEFVRGLVPIRKREQTVATAGASPEAPRESTVVR